MWQFYRTHLWYSLWLNLQYSTFIFRAITVSLRSRWVQYVIFGPIIFVGRILIFLLICTCEDGFPHWFSWTLTGVLDFSLSGDLSFLLICLTGNLWFSFTGFNKIKDLHLPDLLVLMWGCFSGLVSILDVFSDVRHSLSISLLLRSSNLGIFCNIGYANFKASCFLFKEALSFWFHVLISDFISCISIILLLDCLSSACIFFMSCLTLLCF